MDRFGKCKVCGKDIRDHSKEYCQSIQIKQLSIDNTKLKKRIEELEMEE